MTKAASQNITDRSRAAVYWLFGLGTIGAALGNLSQTGLNAMLSAVMSDLGVGVEIGQWLTTGYMLVMGIAVPVATYLMARLSNRAYLLLSFGLFGAGALLDFVTPEFYSMLFGRLLQGVAVGLMVPKMQTVAITKFPPGRRATAMGVAGIALGFAPNVGPTVGGVMDHSFGWRSFFLLLLVLSCLLILATLFFVKNDSDTNPPAHFETISFIYSTLGFGGVLLGLSQASSYGLLSAWTWVPIAVGIVFLIAFVHRQNRLPQPLLDLHIFESRVFRDGLLASVFVFACFMGVTLVIPLYVQNALGGTSFDAGLVILPSTFTALFINPLSGYMADKISVRTVTLIFGSFLVVGSVASVFIGEETPLWLLSVYQTLRAMGVSGLIGPLLTYALSQLEPPLVPHGSSTTVIIRQVSATFGTALMVFCVATFGDASTAVPYQTAFIFSAIMALAAFTMIILRIK